MAKRLDFVLLTEEFFDKTIECNIVSVPFSDHRSCSVVVKISDIIRGLGYWKFNNSLLNYLNFVTKMNNMLDDLKDKYVYDS